MSRAVLYVPKGAMCQKCIHANAPCSGLPFDKMEVIGSYADPGVEIRAVKCTGYIKSDTSDGVTYSSKKGVEVR